MKTKYYFVCFLSCLCCCSCHVVYDCFTKTKTLREPDKKEIYIGNKYKKMIGLTANQILQEMSAPDRKESDGKGGSILIYEDVRLETIGFEDNFSHASVSGSTTNYGEVGSSSSLNGFGSSTNMMNKTTYQSKSYINFFIDTDGQCYNVKTNKGNEYKYEYIPGQYEDCRYERRYKKWSPAGFLLWVFPLAGITYTIAYWIHACKIDNTPYNVTCHTYEK